MSAGHTRLTLTERDTIEQALHDSRRWTGVLVDCLELFEHREWTRLTPAGRDAVQTLRDIAGTLQDRIATVTTTLGAAGTTAAHESVEPPTARQIAGGGATLVAGRHRSQAASHGAGS